jgi:hypothetical protein
MTDKQLIVLIRAWKGRIGCEIDALNDYLTEIGAPLARKRVYIGKTAAFGLVNTEQDNPEAWEWRDTDAVRCLEGLRDLEGELGEAIDMLMDVPV